MAELVIHPLAVAVEELATGVQVEERQAPQLQGLPPPMIPNSPNLSSSACFMLVRGVPSCGCMRPLGQVCCLQAPAAGLMLNCQQSSWSIRPPCGHAHAGGIQATRQAGTGF